MGEEITLLIIKSQTFCGVFCGEFLAIFAKDILEKKFYHKFPVFFRKQIAKKGGGKKSPKITTIAYMMKGFS
jgi:hypothetical protein